ncbi:MAG TPA: redox-sensing transcriptional repressor Rex [Candidatus Mailhella excrementigallinarum]|nr:redox-sensing transcriptional repressor Rex [Candidatus Mailhella excrementigallinarum]
MNVSPKNEHIPRATIQRLATYLQVLEAMHKEGVQVISSEPLSRACDVNASQVRKDLAYFGEFGVRGVGYYVSYLLEAIKVCLHANREWRAALVGVGNLGRALLNHREFRRRGFTIVAAFDCDPFKIGETAYGLEVYCTKTLMERVPELNIEIGIITTPPERAQRAASQLVEAGIKGILNYSAARISVPDTVFVEYVDFFHQIYSLTFNISNRR